MSRTERASGTGSGRNSTEFTTAKVAVLAAIQTAMVRTTVTVNPLSPMSERTACRRLRKADPMLANTLFGRAGVAGILADFGWGRRFLLPPANRSSPDQELAGENACPTKSAVYN